MFNMTDIGKKISELRKRKDMTQMELADLMGISYQAVSNWERGNTMPDISKLGELAGILEVSVDTLIDSEKEARIIEHISEDGKVDLEDEWEVGFEEIVNVAPILKPTQMDDLMDQVEVEEFEGVDYDGLISIIPFVSTDVADDLFKKACENPEVKMKKLIGAVAPFVSQGALDHVVMEALDKEQVNTKFVTQLLPFLGSKSIKAVFKKAKAGGGKLRKIVVNSAPFVDNETLSEAVNEVISSEEIDEKFVSQIIPFVDRDTATKVFAKAVSDGASGVKLMQIVAPFVDQTILDEIIRKSFMK